jgi:hypothetical protein
MIARWLFYRGEATMFYQRPFLRHAASIAGALLVCASPLAAAAQAVTSQLATDIMNQFGADNHYTQGTLGNDWCFNVDKELGYSWWYFDQGDGNGLVAHPIVNTVRIQGTYLDPSSTSNYKKYASLILGLDVLQQGNFPVGVNSATSTLDSLPVKDLAKMKRVTPRVATAPGTGDPFPNPTNPLNVPSSSPSTCFTLGDFLMAYVLPFVPMMQSQPSLRTPNWYKDSVTFDDNYTVRYWMFKGRAHAVINITSYGFGLQDTASTPNQYGNVRLVVGIGGGAGP